MDNELDITNIITGKKKLNRKNLSRQDLTAHIRSPHQKFCYSCGELNPLQNLFIEMFANNLYGYLCVDCNWNSERNGEAS